MKEVWKDVPGTPHHQISNKGRLRATRGTPHFIDKFRILHPSVSNSGYLIYAIRGKIHTIHRMVAEAFIPNPHGLSDVDHINGDKMNNSVENLQWLSHRDNMKKYGEQARDKFAKKKEFLSMKRISKTTTRKNHVVFVDRVRDESLSGISKSNPIYRRIASGTPITIGKYAGKDIVMRDEMKCTSLYEGPSQVAVKVTRSLNRLPESLL